MSRTWKAPKWMLQQGKNQEVLQVKSGWIRNYAGRGGMCKISWDHSPAEHKGGIFRLETPGGEKLVLDKEEVMGWIRYV